MQLPPTFTKPLRHDDDRNRKRSSSTTSKILVLASLAVAETDFVKLLVQYTKKILH